MTLLKKKKKIFIRLKYMNIQNINNNTRAGLPGKPQGQQCWPPIITELDNKLILIEKYKLKTNIHQKPYLTKHAKKHKTQYN